MTDTTSPPTPTPVAVPMDAKNARAAAKAAKAHAKALRPWYKKKRFIFSGIIGVVIAIIFAMQAGGKTTADTTPTASVPPTPGTSSAAPAAAHTGAMLTLTGEGGAKATVQLTQVIDPAQGADQFTTPDAGKRFVATVFKITNTSGSALTGDANNDVSVVGSDNQTYTADFDNVSECTNFASGQYQLAAGESTTGCVVFQVPTGAAVAKVKYSPSSGFANDFGEWLNP
jgi:hypothetical protein